MADKDSGADATEDTGNITANQEAPKPEDGGKQSAPIQLTQEQLTERLERKGQSAISNLLKELGVEDPTVLKSSLEELQSLKAQQMTAEEKVKSDLEAAQKQLDDLRSKAEAAAADALQTKLKLQTLETMNNLERPFTDPAAAMRLVDFGGVINEGSIDAEALTQAISAAAEKYPWALTAQKVKTPGSTDNPPGKETGGRTDEERRATYFKGAGGNDGDFFSSSNPTGGLVVPE